MNLFHTADWHLGQSFHGQQRHFEHQHFLDWLLDTLAHRRPDALLIAGDIFDGVNPSLAAQKLLYDFLVSAHERLPSLDIVMIAGNHDSGARIELPAPLLEHLNVYARGRLYWREDGAPDCERLLIPLTDQWGKTRAWCLALPFLRPSEVTGRSECQALKQENGDDRGGDGEAPTDPYVQGVTRVHEALIEAGRKRRRPGEALIAMSHAHLHGARVSAQSERPIVIGGEESLPATLFPEDIAYVALGHLHRPQRVGAERIRYSGAPVAMDFSEAGYVHQVLEVSVEGERLTRVESLPIPRPVALLRIGPEPLEQVLEALEALSLETTDEEGGDDEKERGAWPWLEVSVTLKAPRVDLRAQIEKALKGRAVRLASLRAQVARDDNEASHPTPREALDPTALFARVWQREYGDTPPCDVMSDFNALLQEIQDDEQECD